jgi:hypothetical protein
MPAHPEIQYRCSFCGKSQEQIHRLIAGPGGVYICNECIDLCQEIIAEETGPERQVVAVDRVAALVGQTQPRYARDASLCPLCQNSLEGDTQVVVASHESPAHDRRIILWRCHASCFHERSRRMT